MEMIGDKVSVSPTITLRDYSRSLECWAKKHITLWKDSTSGSDICISDSNSFLLRLSVRMLGITRRLTFNLWKCFLKDKDW